MYMTIVSPPSLVIHHLTSSPPPNEKPLLHSGELLLAFWLTGAASVGGLLLAYSKGWVRMVGDGGIVIVVIVAPHVHPTSSCWQQWLGCCCCIIIIGGAKCSCYCWCLLLPSLLLPVCTLQAMTRVVGCCWWGFSWYCQLCALVIHPMSSGLQAWGRCVDVGVKGG